MEHEKLISIEQFCNHYQADVAFVHLLGMHDLIEVINIEQAPYIHEEEVDRLERLLRLHDDLEINVEGLNAVAQLLSQVNDLQQELNNLRNKLRIYESEND